MFKDFLIREECTYGINDLQVLLIDIPLIYGIRQVGTYFIWVQNGPRIGWMIERMIESDTDMVTWYGLTSTDGVDIIDLHIAALEVTLVGFS